MKKHKMLICVCIIQSFVIISGIASFLYLSINEPTVKNADLVEYLSNFTEENNYIPNEGYIPDAKTAEAVGSAIIDELAGRTIFGSISVTYDESNRLWKIEKGYLFSNGGEVVIEQDSGRVIKALLFK